jgi:hypothetical protein
MKSVDKHMKSLENWYHTILENNDKKNENRFPMTTNSLIEMVKELTDIREKKNYLVIIINILFNYT